MKNKLNHLLNFMLFPAILCFVCCSCGEMISCNSTDSENSVSLKVMNWNLQTFFDASFDGNEYTEFSSPKSGFSEQKYIQRLSRLEETIKTLDADILIFEELEKEQQLYDISNRLSGTFNFAKLYDYGFFASSENSSIGCGILSRFPMIEAKVHNIDIRTDSSSQPSTRPVIEIKVLAGNKTLTLFVNHWKSKSSGEEESKIWRSKQEALLARLMSKNPGTPKLAAGDFNQNITEFTYHEDGKNNILLHGKQNVAVYSPWIKSNGELVEPGSYYYKENWERIDHFFAAGAIKLSDFAAENKGSWADQNGRPLRYSVWNGNGYSDHLPVTCSVTF